MRGLRNAIDTVQNGQQTKVTWNALIQGQGADCTWRDVHFRTQHFVSAHNCDDSVNVGKTTQSQAENANSHIFLASNGV